MIKRLRKQSGFGLIEVIIALGLLGIISIAFLGTLANASSAIILSDGRTTAESLARSEMEYIKSQEYIDYSVSEHDIYDSLDAPADYILATTAAPFDPDSPGPDKTYDEIGGVYEQDEGIQLITVTVTFFEEEEPEKQSQFELVGYKTKAR
jgi:prepilin-type N-terminal cleavage/methylation domain-containing protein